MLTEGKYRVRVILNEMIIEGIIIAEGKTNIRVYRLPNEPAPSDQKLFR